MITMKKTFRSKTKAHSNEWAQLVNNPQNHDRNQRKRSPSSNVESEFFDIHCSKLKPDPFAYLGEASDECVTHTMRWYAVQMLNDDHFE